VDVMTILPGDDFLREISIPKGSMQLIDMTTMQQIMEKTSGFRQTISTGGSAANTIHGLAQMGISTGFIGSVGQDEFGSFFSEDLTKSQISPYLNYSPQPTGRAIAMITPDSERTFTTYLGASIELSPEMLKKDYFEGYRFFHVEGYLVQDHNLLEQALSMAASYQMTISLDLASYNVVEQNLNFLKKILHQYVDVVFANEEEARAFTGNDPEEALSLLGEMCKIVVVKTGKKGSLVRHQEGVDKIEPIPVESIDTTGAGDLYASGFLFGMCHGLPFRRCGEIGSLLAGRVIETVGSKMTDETWSQIKSSL